MVTRVGIEPARTPSISEPPWWARRAFTRMNIAPTILKNQIEDRLDIMDFRIVF